MIDEVRKAVERFETLSIDHEPDGWPAVRMRDLTLAAQALRDQEAEIARLRGAIQEHQDQFPDEPLNGELTLWNALTTHLGATQHD